MENFNLSNGQIEMLLKLASKKLGKSPDEIKNEVAQGNLDKLVSGLDPAAQSRVAEFVNNPAAVQTVLNGGRLGEILSSFAGGANK